MGQAKNEIEKFGWRIIELMPQLIRGFARHEHNYLSSGRITIPQFWVLEHLFRTGINQMSDLASFFAISRPATTGLIDRLIAQKLVKRKDDSCDRRIVWIEITNKGKAIVRDILKQRHSALTHVFGQISVSDRKQYLQILEQMVEILRK